MAILSHSHSLFDRASFLFHLSLCHSRIPVLIPTLLVDDDDDDDGGALHRDLS